MVKKGKNKQQSEEDKLMDKKFDQKEENQEENQEDTITDSTKKTYFDENISQKVGNQKKSKLKKKLESESEEEEEEEEIELTEEQKQDILEQEKARKERLEKKKLKKEQKKQAELDMKKKSEEIKKPTTPRKRNQDSDSDEEDEKKKEKSAFWDHICIVTFLGIFLILMAFMKYQQAVYNKTAKISADGYNDLYEVLEVDPNSTNNEIRKSYKKLAAKWHPDKNSNCDECETKFQAILKAYEVLGKEASRLEYDQTRGVTNAIKSRAVQLTERNFESLVLESNDVWIIKVYENNNRFSEQLGPFWESTIEKYGGLIKFGRINRENDYQLLQHLPFNIKIVPTIMSFMNDGSESQIYTFDRMNPEIGMHRFVADSITSYVNVFDSKESKDLYRKIRKYEAGNNKVDIVYISPISKMPIEFKYSAYKYNKYINFHVGKYGQSKNIQKDFKTEDHLLVYFNNEETQKREMISFKFQSKKFNNPNFRKILKLAKFLALPEIDRSSFKDFCEVSAISYDVDDNASTNDEDNMVFTPDQSLCFVVNPDDEKSLKEIFRIRKEIFDETVKEFKTSKGEKLFENFFQIQFITLDPEMHWKWTEAITSVPDNKAPLDTAPAYAILSEKRKISFAPKNIMNMEDWIYDLVDNEGDASEYLNEYLAEEHKLTEISQLLKFEQDTIPNLVLKGFKKYKFDYRVILTALVTYATFQYLDRKRADKRYIWKLSLFVYVLLIGLFIYGDIFEELHH